MLRAACIQMCSTEDVTANLASVDNLLARAAEQKVRLAVLPENFSRMGSDGQGETAAAQTRVLPFLAAAARQYGLFIVGGSLPMAGADGRLRNTCPVLAPNGACIARYDKLHLFDVDLPGEPYRESDRVAAGEKPVAIAIDTWRLGLSICYDLRFPELYRHYAMEGCQVLTVPAAFTVPTGRAHWEILLRARAIENQAYVLAAGQAGNHPGGRQTWGHSMIVDPWGEIVAQAGDDEGEQRPALVVADLDPLRLAEVRRQLPALEHRRLHF